ncbi:hypothetical protein [Streptomyces sp. S.PNR 29]|uniref:hypothetical protein n=1 Tax=Streptomyces sp. S.PNR 29 TaxID=2973805 RepID=UPI0025AF027C|nr:hypothetical protein [Streptomyces sp. S.PNR 29]MDN0197232.1 hypothetical protein [Streptomyces sp. S.PNR 29]
MRAARPARHSERPHQFRLLAEPPDEPAALERVAALVDEQNAKLAAALADGVSDGSLASDLDPVTTATALWAAMNGVLGLSWRADRLRADASHLTELVAAVERVVLRGLLAR